MDSQRINDAWEATTAERVSHERAASREQRAAAGEQWCLHGESSPRRLCARGRWGSLLSPVCAAAHSHGL